MVYNCQHQVPIALLRVYITMDMFHLVQILYCVYADVRLKFGYLKINVLRDTKNTKT